jgi:hypothetical protein
MRESQRWSGRENSGDGSASIVVLERGGGREGGRVTCKLINKEKKRRF